MRERVLIVDDLIATGGTAKAARSLIEKAGGVVLDSASSWAYRDSTA